MVAQIQIDNPVHDVHLFSCEIASNQDQSQRCSSIFSKVMRKNMKMGQEIAIQEFCHLLNLVGTSILYKHYLNKIGEFEILIQ